jgi:hypothetical protein
VELQTAIEKTYSHRKERQLPKQSMGPRILPVILCPVDHSLLSSSTDGSCLAEFGPLGILDSSTDLVYKIAKIFVLFVPN